MQALTMPNPYDKNYYEERYINPLFSKLGLAKLYYLWIAFFCLILPSKLRRNSLVLEVGCGIGNLVWALRLFGIKAYGWDPSEAAARYCQAPNYCRYQISLREAYHNKHFDLVYTNEVLEHLAPDTLKSLCRHIRALSHQAVHMVGVSEKGPIVRNDETHLIVKPEKWWAKTLAGFGYTVSTGNLFYFFPSVLFTTRRITDCKRGYFFLRGRN